MKINPENLLRVLCYLSQGDGSKVGSTGLRMQEAWVQCQAPDGPLSTVRSDPQTNWGWRRR